MSEIAADGLSDAMRRFIETVDIANALTEPLTQTIRDILKLSSRQLNSSEASVLVRNGEAGDLRFLAAIGSVAEQLINLIVPAGKGIAGFVYSSGQPMAVSDVGEEQAFYAEVDKKTGFSTHAILATPLSVDGEVIGVLEYINKIGDSPNEGFSTEDMDQAALYAEAISSVVSAYDSARMIKDLGDKLAEQGAGDLADLRNWVRSLRESAEYKDMLDLALMIRNVAFRGEAERQLCKDILDAVMRYSDNRSSGGYLSY